MLRIDRRDFHRHSLLLAAVVVVFSAHSQVLLLVTPTAWFDDQVTWNTDCILTLERASEA